MSMALVSGAVVLSGCGWWDRQPAYTPGAIPQSSGAKDDTASVAAYILSDRNEQRKYFGVDLTSNGVIPVFLQITNASKGNLIFERDRIQVANANDTLSASERAKNPVYGTGAKVVTGAAVASLVLMSAAGVVLFMPIAGKMAADNAAFRRNVIEKEFYSRTLLPGETANGFIFLSSKDNTATGAGYDLKVILTPLPPAPSAPDISYTIRL
jgi:hypothetical protein